MTRNAFRLAAVAASVLALSTAAQAADAPPAKPPAAAPTSAAGPTSVTRGAVTIEGKKVAYTAKAGRLTLTSGDNTPAAYMFYVAYVADRAPGAPERPVTFVYNGGPGSSTVWLHMGGLSPVYARTDSPAPTRPSGNPLVENDQSILDRTDLVFLDAIGTGYSRLASPDMAKEFYGIDKDAAAFAQAIKRYVGENGRWDAPKYVLGESYGSPRSAVLAHKLAASNINLNGVVLMSSILNFGQHASGLDREPVNLIPTYAASAWHHQRVPRGEGLEAHVQQAREFALGPYAAALSKGHKLPAAERAATAQRLEALTGVSAQYWDRANLRVLSPRFTAELLRDQGKIIGSSDTRFTGTPADGVQERAGADPAGGIGAAYVSGFNRHVAGTLKYAPEMDYIVVDGAMMDRWTWSHQPPGGAPFQYSGANTTVDLAVAMRANPHLKVLSLSGYYDLTTPFFATEWDLAHMNLPPALAANITERYLPGGHMPYLDQPGLAAMRRELVSFYDQAAAR